MEPFEYYEARLREVQIVLISLLVASITLLLFAFVL